MESWISKRIAKIKVENLDGFNPQKYEEEVLAELRALYLECADDLARQSVVEAADWAKGLSGAENARDEALSRVKAAAHGEWVEAAQNALHLAAKENEYLTSDTVWDYMPDDVWTHELRAMGAVFKDAQKQGFIESTQHLAISHRGHAGSLRVWRSKFYDGEWYCPCELCNGEAA